MRFLLLSQRMRSPLAMPLVTALTAIANARRVIFQTAAAMTRVDVGIATVPAFVESPINIELFQFNALAR